MSEPPLISPAELADELGLNTETLLRWRQSDTGPAWHKFGARIRYSRADVDSWLAGQRRTA